MREIKFRAWDSVDDEMMSNQELNFNEMSPIQQGEYFSYMQYTGLEDEDRNEVYEGDIVSISFLDSEFYGKAKVVFKNYSWAYEWIDDKEAQTQPFYEVPKDEFVIKIIGNIYKNKELLK